MDNVLVIGAGPAGLLAAWVARQRGARVKVMASGIGTTHVSPGWLQVLHEAPGKPWEATSQGKNRTSQFGIEASAGLSGQRTQPAEASIPREYHHIHSFITAHPRHPYALAGLDALHGGIAALREVGQAAGINFVSTPDLTGLRDLSGLGGANFRLPTALGAVAEAALVPGSFAAGDLRQPGSMLIAGPAGWRDFYPRLCAENLARQGFAAQGVCFDLPEMAALSQFDATPVGLAHLLERADVRQRVAAQLRPKLNGAARVGFPAVLGLAGAAEAWADLCDRLGVPIFEIPTLPPSVPGMRLFNAFKAALTAAGVPILLDMTATKGFVESTRLDSQSGIEASAGLSGQRQQPAKASIPESTGIPNRDYAAGVVVPDVVRDRTYHADTYILATGGLYGGGITSDFRGTLREAIFGLPLHVPGEVDDWFDPTLLAAGSHPIHMAGVRANARMQPVDETGRVLLANVRVAGRLLAGCNPAAEGSTEGVWLATAYRAAIDG